MLDSVLRVYGEEFDVDSFLREYPISTISNAYHKGDIGILKKVHKDSGFVALISENINSHENMLEIESFIHENEAAFSYLKNLGITIKIDVGCTVGTQDQFTKSVVATPSLLGLLYKFSVSLEFSAYPASDEEIEK